MSRYKKFFLIAIAGIFLCTTGCFDAGLTEKTGPVGWAVGEYPDHTAAILYTADGGLSWETQGDTSLWTGFRANDISAVDDNTAWAVLGRVGEGMILHTNDGGATWDIQQIVNEEMKGVKGLTASTAWVVGLRGTVMLTLDGGQTWEVVPHGIDIGMVNRIDARDQNIWIADHLGVDDQGQMVHSDDFGETWRIENLPYILRTNGPMTVSIVNNQTAWSSVSAQGDLYRTIDGGNSWQRVVDSFLAQNDIDDLCAVNEDTVWGVYNVDVGISGLIFWGRLVEGGFVFETWDPAPEYVYAGITCLDEDAVWAVGFKRLGGKPDLPEGVIVHTDDGGATWETQLLPADNICLWKVSFSGALR